MATHPPLETQETDLEMLSPKGPWAMTSPSKGDDASLAECGAAGAGSLILPTFFCAARGRDFTSKV